jgi:hypothetical protein
VLTTVNFGGIRPAPAGHVIGFVGGTATVVLTAGQRVTASSAVVFYTATGTGQVCWDMCYRLSGSTAEPTSFTATNQCGEVSIVNLSYPVSASTTIPAAGTYDIGECMEWTTATPVSVDYGNGFLYVTN